MKDLDSKEKIHESVLVGEVLRYLGLTAPLNRARKYIDATVGTGGHTLEVIARGGEVLGIDADKEMLKIAEGRLKGKGIFKLVQGNFRKIDEIAETNGFDKVDGIIFDLGVSNLHLTSSDRGISFVYPEAILDMRLDRTSQGVTAADLLNGLRKDQLMEMFLKVLKWPEAKFLTNSVLKKREGNPFRHVGDFLEIADKLRGKPGLNPATLGFLALRIAVNSELENLKEALPKAFAILKEGGKLMVISFHSGEDGITRDFFREMEEEGKGKVITEDATTPSEEEVVSNPRSRSARLRVIEKNENSE